MASLGSKSVSFAQLLALLVQSFFFGLQVATFVPCFKAMTWERGSFKPLRSIRWWLLTVSVLMLGLSSLGLALLFQHNANAFIYHQQDGGSEAYFHVLSSYINVARAAAFGTQACLGQLVLLYRCYTVWGKKWQVIVLPALLQIVANCSSFAVPYLEARESTGLITSSSLNRWTTLTNSSAAAMEVLTTGLICFKMWRVSRRTANAYPMSSSGYKSPIHTAMIIFMESGIIMAVGYVALVIASLSRSLAVYPVSDAILPLIGITFNLIIIRIANRKEETETIPSSQPSYPLRFVAAVRNNTRQPHGRGANVQVDVTTATEYDGDRASSKLETDKWTD